MSTPHGIIIGLLTFEILAKPDETKMFFAERRIDIFENIRTILSFKSEP
jgi:hypothetical protein